ncbi:hypothetical protein GCM10027517_07150 [Phycicoccus ginsengisoli]
MGMDVYVGPLARYLARDWMTTVQQVGAATGRPVQVLRPDDEPAPDRGSADAMAAAWQRELLEALGSDTPWADRCDLPYWTDKPDWDGYGGLVLLAAYLERPDLEPSPARGLLRRARGDEPRDFGEAEAYRAASAAPKRFPSLLGATQWWLPVETGGRVFRASRPDGPLTTMAPLSRLLLELKDLAEAIGLADKDERLAIRAAGPPDRGADVATCGRFGLSVFLPLAAHAYVERQPLVLDF